MTISRHLAVAIRCAFCFAVSIIVMFTAPNSASAIGFVLGESKEELKLKYDVAVTDHGTGRVTLVFTLEDEGRLAPLEAVQFAIPGTDKSASGGHWMDLVVSIEMKETGSGKRIGRVHILKELAERGNIRLNTHTMDGKLDPLTRLHHVIPVSKHMPVTRKDADNDAAKKQK